MAIIAALSVQYSKAGIKVFQPNFLPSISISFLKLLFAETPPANAMFYIPVCLLANNNFFIKYLFLYS